MIVRIALIVGALISLFMFPWPVSLAAILVASLALPVAGLFLGVFADILYFVPGAAFMPYMTVWGIGSCIAALLVHRFVKTRIMD